MSNDIQSIMSSGSDRVTVFPLTPTSIITGSLSQQLLLSSLFSFLTYCNGSPFSCTLAIISPSPLAWRRRREKEEADTFKNESNELASRHHLLPLMTIHERALMLLWSRNDYYTHKVMRRGRERWREEEGERCKWSLVKCCIFVFMSHQLTALMAPVRQGSR